MFHIDLDAICADIDELERIEDSDRMCPTPAKPNSSSPRASASDATDSSRGEHIRRGFEVMSDGMCRAYRILVCGATRGCSLFVYLIIGDKSNSEMVSEASGALFAVACLLLANCWLVDAPYITSVTLSISSMCAAVVMNTIEWDRFTSSQTLIHTQAMMLAMVCFVSFFCCTRFINQVCLCSCTRFT